MTLYVLVPNPFAHPHSPTVRIVCVEQGPDGYRVVNWHDARRKDQV